MVPHSPTLRRRTFAIVLTLGGLAALTGCEALLETPPAPTPADFQGIAADIVKRGISIDNIVSGDAGCEDNVDLARTAIGFDAGGLDQASPTRIYVYIFRNRDAYERLRETVDACARSFVVDPEDFESGEQSPFVVAGAGPWAPDFHDAIREALIEAAGTGN